MNLWNSICGMVTVELTSAEPESALGIINEIGIELQYLQKTGELSYYFRTKKRYYSKIEELCKKRGEKVRIVQRNGIYWSGIQLQNRPILCTVFLCVLLTSLFLSSRVFFVKVEGNEHVPANKIIEAAEACGICFGASRREVRSEQVKNSLLSAVPELQWAGVNTAGCVAVISVRERPDQNTDQQNSQVSSVVADRDGYILSATSTQGNLCVAAGQTVQKGQVLISGYTDCGILIQASRSEGEIIALTNRTLQVVTNAKYESRCREVGTKKKYSLLIRKKRINLWKDSGISDATCGRMYEEYYVTLPGGFQLPLALCVDTYTLSETESAVFPKEYVESALHDFAGKYLTEHMVAGTVHNAKETLLEQAGFFRQTGSYVCVEMIGRERQERIGEFNGKNS